MSLVVDEYIGYDATDLSELLTHKQVTATEIVTAAFEAAELLNGPINAIVESAYPSYDDRGTFLGHESIV
ncbi:MAG: hypothetical protein ACYDHP_09580 [Ferrimicrobium sp.]